ncbi:hypothetical protein J2T17_007659 [Paenibacillus mucilaginosus]
MMYVKYILFFLINFIATYFIFPEPSYVKSFWYSVFLLLFVYESNQDKKRVSYLALLGIFR